MSWSFRVNDAEIDFLADGQTLTQEYRLTVTDGAGATDTQVLTITITGTNDAPVLTAINVEGVITEGSVLSDAGSIAFADVDLTDVPTATAATKSVEAYRVGGLTPLVLTGDQQAAIEAAFSIAPAGGNFNNGTINWTYSIAEGGLDFLAEGETVTAVFTVTVDDQEGGEVTQDVTVNITGTNDVPVLMADNPLRTVTETSAPGIAI